jgi:A/G-specific adenine glycosylase
LQKAARQIAECGAFPNDYEAILELAGVGAYTAAAIASISFGQPHAVVDGNVRRVMARVMNDGHVDAQQIADQLLDRRDPARWNQAVMELGATICLPREPRCEECPIAAECLAREAGTQGELPLKRSKAEPEKLERTLLIIQRGGRTLFTLSSRVVGFFDLPEPFRGARVGAVIGEFTHTITHRHYTFIVKEAAAATVPGEARWLTRTQLKHLPIATTAKKALALYKSV